MMGCLPRSGISKRLIRAELATLCFFLIAQSFLFSQVVDWPTLSFTQIVTNTIAEPTYITHAGDGSGRIFVLSQPGKIWIIQNSNVLAQPFLDISGRVTTYGAEQGLLGLTFPPGFSTNRHCYVDYTRKSDGAIVVSRYFLTATNSNVADSNSEQIILVIQKPESLPGFNNPNFDNHNAGQLAFGPDGYLYIGVGDGGSENDPFNIGQQTNTFLGKLLRIDVESGVSPYAIPPSNPFVSSNGYYPEIWALGLRNPWRFSFDDLSGDLYIADVGENKYEEIDFQPAGSSGGQNYGWRIMEGDSNFSVPSGFTNFASLTLPVAIYSHASLPYSGQAAVIGGYVYRGPSQPRINGMYFYGDFIAGWIWGLIRTGTNWQSQVLFNPVSGTNFNISTFGEDDIGNLYVSDYYRGKIYQIQDTHQVWTPTFTPPSGVINSNTIVVNCLTTNVEIHYTTSGSAPSLSDPIVAAGQTIQVATGITNKLAAFRSDLNPSSVATAIYTLQVGTPIFNPSPQSVTNGTPISISTVTPGATIYYTTNGVTPTTNSLIYSSPVAIQGNTTLEAIAFEEGYTNSHQAVGNYPLAIAATPVFSPPVGPITNGTLVSISCSTPNSVIYYTLDGTTTTTNSPVYSEPFAVNSGTTLTAFATANSYGNSGTATTTYLFKKMESTVVTTVVAETFAGELSAPNAICIDSSGNFYVANGGDSSVFKITPFGHATNIANISSPRGICMDASGNIYVGDGNHTIWEIQTNGSSAVFAVFPGGANDLGSIKMGPDGNLYAGFFGSVQKIAPDGTVSVLGGPECSGCPGWAIYVGLGVDAETNVYATTEDNIWQLTPNGTTTLYAGGNSGYVDGPALSAAFQNPQDAAVDASGNVYISDVTAVRRISPAGYVSTMAGGGVSGYLNGPGSVAEFNGVAGLCVDTNGNIFIADSGNNCIREISPDTYGIGIPDWWQLKYFGYVGINPNEDPDNTGMTAYEDFWAGLNPTNPASVFKIAAFATNGAVQVNWTSVLGKTYTIEWSTNLIQWNSIGNSMVGNGSPASFTDSSAGTQSTERFYRVVVSF